MPHYVMLMSWTEDGLATLRAESKDLASADADKGLGERMNEQLTPLGGSVTSFFTTLGDAYDMVAVVQANEDVVVSGLAMWLTDARGVMTTVMRATDPNDQDPFTGGNASTLSGILYRCYSDVE
jgi:uncharacterized protein with GYD domain